MGSLKMIPGENGSGGGVSRVGVVLKLNKRCVCIFHGSQTSLTSVEFTVLSQLLSLFVELLGGVEAAVAVEVDAGREVHHEVGERGDLLQDELVLLQHLSHVCCQDLRTVEEELMPLNLKNLFTVI